MVGEHGGLEAARQLLKGRDASGFTTLWETGAFGHDVEAAALPPPLYEVLFMDEDRRVARRRLGEHRFDVDDVLERRAAVPPSWYTDADA